MSGSVASHIDLEDNLDLPAIQELDIRGVTSLLHTTYRHSDQTSAKLSPELIDIIIDHSHSDKHTLCIFSLVCRGWLCSSRYHLFSTLKLNETGALGLLELLDSQTSTFLSHYVREINFTFEGDCQTAILFSVIYRLGWFPHVSSMVMTFKKFAHLAVITPNILRLNFETLTHLEISKVHFATFVEFTTLLCSFPLLHSLVLRKSWNTKQERPSLHWCNPPASLESLEIDCGIEHILEWFLSLDPIPSLSSLSFLYIMSDDMPHIIQYLSTLGPTLKDLRLEFANVDFAAFFERLDLSIHTKLRSLNLDEVPHCMPSFLTIMPQILSQIQSEETEEIGLVIHSESSRDLCELPWVGIEQGLACPQFSRLRSFRMRLVGDDLTRVGENMAYIHKMLPRVANQGILGFETELESDYLMRRVYS